MSHQFNRADPIAQPESRTRSIHDEIRGRELDILRALGIPAPRGRASHITCPCKTIHNDRNPSWRWDARKVRWYCTHGTGNAVDLVMQVLGLDFAGAATWIRLEVFGIGSQGIPHPAVIRVSDAEREAQRLERERADAEYWAQRRSVARALYRRGIHDKGIIDPYLRSRGIAPRMAVGTIRLLPASPGYPHPCMVAPYGLPQEPEPGHLSITLDDVHGIHLTKLRFDGSGKADVPRDEVRRSIAGHGWPIVLTPVNDGGGLIIGEGIETMCSVAQETGLGCWAAGAASWMPALAERVPRYVECVTVYAEHDGGYQHAERLAQLLDTRGIEVRMAEAR